MTTLIKPPRLKHGDTIGIAAPASAFDQDAFLRGVAFIRETGYRTFFREDIFSRDGYLAGTDGRRASELMELFSHRDVRAILCARGGYGSQRIIPLLDPQLVRSNPKIFMGYSDVTALHAYLQATCNLVTFHGPLVTELATLEEDASHLLFQSLSLIGPWGELPCGHTEVLRPGRGEGALAGGSLSVLSATLGTPYAPDMRGTIIFLEDRNEKPYAIDRFFTHLRLAGAFDAAQGLILGQFIAPRGWGGSPDEYQAEVRRVALDAVGEFCFPVLSNFPAGHVRRNICFPLGVRAAVDGVKGSVLILEPALTD
jgi:muramoyltetrapeptide carboxypeptidase